MAGPKTTFRPLPADQARIDALVQFGVANTQSEAIRFALRHAAIALHLEVGDDARRELARETIRQRVPRAAIG